MKISLTLILLVTCFSMSAHSGLKFKCSNADTEEDCKRKNKKLYCEYIDKQVGFLKRELQNGYDTYHHDKYREKIDNLTKDKSKYCN